MGEETKHLRLIVTEPGTRLDKFISNKYPAISRTHARRLIDADMVTVNGRVAKPSLLLETGDEVLAELPPPAAANPGPEAIPISVLYEDDDLMVVDKPAGLTVHPAPGHPTHTLVNAVLSRLQHGSEGFDPQRPGIVHRLDKDTSGLIIVAKNVRSHYNLADQFKKRTVAKAYLALVQGRLTPAEGAIDAPIGRDRSHRERMTITDEGHGRQARTVYRVIKYFDKYSLLELTPETGRTHQIRVHLAAIGYPIVGDRVYGATSSLVGRHFLHAARIGFRLPSNGAPVEFISDLPPDLRRALQELGQPG